MLRFIIVSLLVLPFIDLYILIELASQIGLFKTLAVILTTGLVGAEIVRREARPLIQRISTSVTVKEVSRNMMEGVMLAIGGIMLLTPGLITDIIGLLMVVRPTRQRLMLYVAERLENSANVEFEIRRF